MAMHPHIQEQITEYCQQNQIVFSPGIPSSYTSSIPKKNNYFIVKFTDPSQLPGWMAFLEQIRHQQEPPILLTSAVIGGGRGGENNSYSIANLWEGVDILIQLAWAPYIQIKELQDNKPICRIAPNIMLLELNQLLFEQGYHCPELFGVLPFMSFAGGLSTQSHTASCYLYEIVEGVELLLQNGQTIYIDRNDPKFDHFFNPTLGLLGIILGIDIRVKKGAKDLKRDITFLQYGRFIQTIEEQAAAGVPLNKRVFLISPLHVERESLVKMSAWDWVDPEPTLHRATHKQTITLAATTSFASFMANNATEKFAQVFSWGAMCSLQNGTTKTQRPDKIMGPEDSLSGAITEMELFFDYEPQKAIEFFEYLAQLLQKKQLEKEFPINTALMVRLIQKGRRKNDYRVAVDFVSFGLYLENIKHFVLDLVVYLQRNQLNPSFHSGKTAGVMMNHLCQRDNWEQRKNSYAAFYNDHQLLREPLQHRLAALERPQASAALFNALDQLDKTIRLNRQNPYELNRAAKKIWHACRVIIVKENNLSEDELARLTEFVKGTTALVSAPYNTKHLDNYSKAMTSIDALRSPWKKILCEVGICLLCLSFIAICVASAITTFGISTPVSVFAFTTVCAHYMPIITGVLGGGLGSFIFVKSGLSAKNTRDMSLAHTSDHFFSTVKKIQATNQSSQLEAEGRIIEDPITPAVFC